jgi:hypothetical protein
MKNNKIYLYVSNILYYIRYKYFNFKQKIIYSDFLKLNYLITLFAYVINFECSYYNLITEF